jgi:hypothetical protein
MARYGRLHQQMALPGFGDDAFDEIEGPDPFDNERIRRIVDESFYGQADVRLIEVERALHETHRTVGSPTELRAFVDSALRRYGVEMQDQGDGTFVVPVGGEAILELGESLHCTFDAWKGADDPDLDVIDLAHPLVRRLIDLVRDDAVGSERGRFSARSTRAARRVVALAHVLARFTTAGERPVVMEELLSVPLPVYDDDEPVQGAELLDSPPAPVAQNAPEVVAAGRTVLERPDRDVRVARFVEERRRLLADRHGSLNGLGPRWGAEFGTVREASRDLLALTIVFPHRG